MTHTQSLQVNSLTLNYWERVICEIMGPRRKLDSDKQKRKTRNTLGSKSQIHLDYLGFIGELAFAKMHNLYPNFIDKPDNKWDYKLKDGRTVDVKTTAHEQGKKKRLLIKTSEASRLNSDLYALMYVNLADLQVTLKGFATPRMVMEASIVNFGYGHSFALEFEELKDLSDV